jgi:hypothetical protein
MKANPVEEYAHEEFPVDSITALANAAGVTYGTVHKTIQGLYSAIPKSLVDYIEENSDYSENYWQDRYSLWVHEELEILKGDIKRGAIEATALFIPAMDIAETYSTFRSWRESLSYSQIDFCKTFHLHQTIMNNYESGKMKNLPVSLRERLSYLGLSDDYIKAVGELSV